MRGNHALVVVLDGVQDPGNAGDVAQVLDLGEERRSVDLPEQEEAVDDEVLFRAALEVTDELRPPLVGCLLRMEETRRSDHVEDLVLGRVRVIRKTPDELVVFVPQGLLREDIQVARRGICPKPVPRGRGTLRRPIGVISLMRLV